MKPRCTICKVNPREVGERCRTCYEYRRRHGHERPWQLASRQADLNKRRAERGKKAPRTGPRFKIWW